MSATMVDFTSLASELEDAFLEVRASLERTRELLARIRDGAREDNHGGLPRLGEAVHFEARAVYCVMFEDRDEDNNLPCYEVDLEAIRDLRSLIALAGRGVK